MKNKFVVFIIIFLIFLLAIIGFDYKNNKDKELIDEDKTTQNINSFEIYSMRLNCHAIKLEVKEDKTYKVIYGYKNNEEISKDGKFIYDVSKIVDNNYKYEDSEYGAYSLKTIDGKTYNISASNQDLINFLKEIDIDLDTCLVND